MFNTNNNGSIEDANYIIVGEWISVVLLNLLSAILSGLVLGLLSLDITDLEVLKKCGTERERRYAAAIIPMRKLSNLLLCSLTLANVITNSFLQFILDHLFPGLIGFISTTACITIFGEILPQAVCSRHGLAIGARTIWITWLVVAITFPVAYPLSFLLDIFLGEEISFVYDRERLQEYIRITKSYNGFDPQEINIISGALKIKKVPISYVMTRLKDVYMLEISTIITHNVILNIVRKGFSRIPVYEKSKRNVVGLLLIKDLALVNPFNEVTLKSLIAFYKHPLMAVDEQHTLDVVFNHFREGRSHMALVKEHKRHDIIGIVTLEDVIEEVLQVEINDETDVVTDNREMRFRPDAQIPTDLDALHLHLNEAMARRRVKMQLQYQHNNNNQPQNKDHNQQLNKEYNQLINKEHPPAIAAAGTPPLKTTDEMVASTSHNQKTKTITRGPNQRLGGGITYNNPNLSPSPSPQYVNLAQIQGAQVARIMGKMASKTKKQNS